METLRDRILSYMRGARDSNRNVFCTWWFKFHVSGCSGTQEIRRELERMKRDGLVTSDHSQANNTKWSLTP